MIIMTVMNISYLFSAQRKGMPVEVKRWPTLFNLFTKGVIMCCCCELVSVSGQELVGAAPYIREEAAIAPQHLKTLVATLQGG